MRIRTPRSWLFFIGDPPLGTEFYQLPGPGRVYTQQVNRGTMGRSPQIGPGPLPRISVEADLIAGVQSPDKIPGLRRWAQR